MHAPAGAGIFALRILAHDHPVEFRAVDRAQRADDPRQHAYGTDIGVLIERLADREPEAPEADMIGHVRRADRPEIDRVRAPDLIEAIGRHHQTRGPIMVRSPVEPIEGPFEPTLALSQRLEDLEAGGNDLLADAIAGNDGNPIAPHEWGSGALRGPADGFGGRALWSLRAESWEAPSAPPGYCFSARRSVYFWMQVSAVALVHSSSPVNTGSSTFLPLMRSIITDGAL